MSDSCNFYLFGLDLFVEWERGEDKSIEVTGVWITDDLNILSALPDVKMETVREAIEESYIV